MEDLTLADPHFDLPGKIGLIIGTNLLQDIVTADIRHGSPDQPIAIKTIFGWAMSGRYQTDSEHNSSQTAQVYHFASNLSSDELLQRFWETEEVSTPSQCYLPEEQVVLDYFKFNHVHLPAGCYQVSLPKKIDPPPMGMTRMQAVRMFYSNEASMIHKGSWKKFQDVVEEYLNLRHAEPLSSTDLTKPPDSVYYLPMHAVCKETSSTTKLRVVFDASARDSTGTSLNDTLLVGPTLYPNLTGILIRFRSYLVAISADISKMYWAVELDLADWDLHWFMWRPQLLDFHRLQDDKSHLRCSRITLCCYLSFTENCQ